MSRLSGVIGREVIRLEFVGSTMDEVAGLAAAGAEEGVVIVANVQTAGRGRSGRTWVAPPGSCLLMSVLLRPTVSPERLSCLSLVAGVAIAEALERFGLAPELKWPNDVWLDGRKAAGVLVNTRVGLAGTAAILGIGINVNVDPDTLPSGATSMSAALGVPVPRGEVLDAVLESLDVAYLDFQGTGGRPDLAGWTRRAALIGEQVRVQDGSALHSGEMLGIDRDGALLLREPDGKVISIVAGDLTRGPRPARSNG